MSVKVTNFETWEYVHDDAPGGSHGGTLDPADALNGQLLHVQVAMRPGLGREGKTAEQAAAEVKARVVATDGEERWILDNAALAVLEARAHA